MIREGLLYVLNMKQGQQFKCYVHPYEGVYHVKGYDRNILYVEERDDIAIEVTDKVRWIKIYEETDSDFVGAQDEEISDFLGL